MNNKLMLVFNIISYIFFKKNKNWMKIILIINFMKFLAFFWYQIFIKGLIVNVLKKKNY